MSLNQTHNTLSPYYKNGDLLVRASTDMELEQKRILLLELQQYDPVSMKI